MRVLHRTITRHDTTNYSIIRSSSKPMRANRMLTIRPHSGQPNVCEFDNYMDNWNRHHIHTVTHTHKHTCSYNKAYGDTLLR